MSFLEKNCTLQFLSDALLNGAFAFDCDHKDLNEFFEKDFINYSKELFGKTYCFTLDSNPKEIVCAFSISNDSIKAKNLPNNTRRKVNQKIPYVKQGMKSYPAVLIGRLGIHKDYKNRRIGTDLMNFIKSWFIDSKNKTGCRFVVVDSYNEKIPLTYYEKNGFKFLFKTEGDEKGYSGIISSQPLKTRLMYFDLIVLSK